MEFDAASPVYIQIGERIREEIVRGLYRPGEKLRSVREYAVFYEVSPLTMHRAMQYLEAEGLVVTRKGVGSFVNPRMEASAARRMRESQARQFVEKMREMGLSGPEILELVQECVREEAEKGGKA